jgi:hypothetical protein
VSKTNILLLVGGDCIVSDGVKDEFLPRLFNIQVIPVTFLLGFVLYYELFAPGCCVAGNEGICGVCSWVGGYRVGPGGVAAEKPVLAYGDCTCQMAVLLSLSVVMGVLAMVKIPPSSSLSLSMASGVITPLRCVSLSQRLMSVSYALFNAEEVEVDSNDK